MRISLTVTLPKKKFSAAPYLNAIEKQIRNQAAKDLISLFQETVDGWDAPPDFVARFSINPSSIGVTVVPSGPNAQTYTLVSRGSPPHEISPRKGGFLHYQPGYTPATTPGVLRSRAKSRFGNFVRASAVHHPGFEAREFPKTVREAYQDQFASTMQDAMKDAAKQ